MFEHLACSPASLSSPPSLPPSSTPRSGKEAEQFCSPPRCLGPARLLLVCRIHCTPITLQDFWFHTGALSTPPPIPHDSERGGRAVGGQGVCTHAQCCPGEGPTGLGALLGVQMHAQALVKSNKCSRGGGLRKWRIVFSPLTCLLIPCRQRPLVRTGVNSSSFCLRLSLGTAWAVCPPKQEDNWRSKLH